MTVQELPALSDEYPVTESQQEQFRRDGFIVMRHVASHEEVGVYRKVIGDAVEEFRTERRPLEERDTYAKAFIQVGGLWGRDEGVKQFVFARRFAKLAADLLGVDAVRLYHGQALYKEPGGGHSPWHQDQYYWPLDTDKTVTMWMPLVDTSVEMGPITFAAGSHKHGYLGHLEISDRSQELFGKLVEERGFPVRNSAMAAGDATFHYGWTLHTAPPNTTNRMREVMTIIYMADGVRILEPDNPARKGDLAGLFPGKKPGDLAAGELSPILYQR
jgi:ectoine hydroxylase-related dioxygenase (phytanoyl-CoA dioxygenase family)